MKITAIIAIFGATIISCGPTGTSATCNAAPYQELVGLPLEQVFVGLINRNAPDDLNIKGIGNQESEVNIPTDSLILVLDTPLFINSSESTPVTKIYCKK